MKYLIAMALAFIVPVSVLAVCAEGEVWQPEITYKNGACIETVQSHTGQKLGINSHLVCWIAGHNWFEGKCYKGGTITNQCVAYEQIEVDSGQCVADSNDDSNDNDGGGDNEGGDSEGGETGDDTKNVSRSSGTSLWTRLSNVSGVKYTRENISLQDGLALYDKIMKEKIAQWEIIKEQRKPEKMLEREARNK
jgi:hypothetical protein